MNSDYKDKRLFNPARLFRSFFYAWRGIRRAINSEQNLRIHVIAAFIVIILAVLFKLSVTEWLFILIAIGGMFSLELINSAIERVVDLNTDQYHPLAEQAKDMAAGAVMVYAFLSVVIGAVIFLPKLMSFIKSIQL